MLDRRHLLVLGASALAAERVRAADTPLTVFAAASLKEALDAINLAWRNSGRMGLRLVYGASGTLARQIQQGAPADLVILADEQWMRYLAERGLVKAGTIPLAKNRLVLVSSTEPKQELELVRGLQAGHLLAAGRLVIGDPASVPAGAYAKATLQALGLWENVRPHLIMTENVRIALALVARGEAGRGFVYASDAQAEGRVRVIANVPPGLHPPIRYPMAMVSTSSNPGSQDLLAFLAGSKASEILLRLGFGLP